MKIRALTHAIVVAAFTGAASLGAAGAALAQSASPTAPSTTPNDGTAVQPNRPVPPGQAAPAPNAAPNTMTTPPNLDKNAAPSSDKRSGEMPTRHREANDNVPRTPAAGATPPPGYPNSGGSK
ncbi:MULTISPECIES: hypothetical protein [Achromobacter]|uniref:hypothetical protein n=1 Tax=Achromobacter TaxID=222 RepID=UPI00046A7AE0|nr:MULTISPECIES: hypothetical protein [Achromobacter]CAB3844644.1 hypothetical protein LMG3412_01434 [Achromobacter deleyi]